MRASRPHLRLVLLLLLLAVSHSWAQESWPTQPADFQLISWRDPVNGGWNFSILPGSSESQRRVLKGMGELKRRISELPSGGVIYWVDSTPGSGSKAGTYPPAKIIQQVRDFAKTRHIKVQIVSSYHLLPEVQFAAPLE